MQISAVLQPCKPLQQCFGSSTLQLVRHFTSPPCLLSATQLWYIIGVQTWAFASWCMYTLTGFLLHGRLGKTHVEGCPEEPTSKSGVADLGNATRQRLHMMIFVVYTLKANRPSHRIESQEMIYFNRHFRHKVANYVVLQEAVHVDSVPNQATRRKKEKDNSIQNA